MPWREEDGLSREVERARLTPGPLTTSAAGSWREPARYVVERFESVAEHCLSALCPLRDRPCHDVPRQRGGT
jgi:hypothetical protein